MHMHAHAHAHAMHMHHSEAMHTRILKHTVHLPSRSKVRLVLWTAPVGPRFAHSSCGRTVPMVRLRHCRWGAGLGSEL